MRLRSDARAQSSTRQTTVNPVDKTLRFIESHADANLSLDAIASGAGVSKYYLLRAFSAATGVSIMRYVRSRRLAAAARRLASGAEDILSVAIECGYGSHEAFTRAFRDQFGLTPETVRAQGHVRNIRLVDAVAVDRAPSAIAPARFEIGRVLLIAGVAQRYEGVESASGIPEQWRRFERELAQLGLRANGATCGVCYNTDDEGGMDYLCGAEVSTFASLPGRCTRLRIAARSYAVFLHVEPIAEIRRSWNAIWNGWLPQSGHEAADAPLLERYDERFDRHTGRGGIELWVPLV